MSIGELLEAWRDALRAAELADRLTRAAAKATNDADVRSHALPELAEMAQQAAIHATAIAERATAAAAAADTAALSLRQEDAKG